MAITLLSPNLGFCTLQALLFMASLGVSAPAPAAPKISQLFQFTYPTAVKNLFPLPNGCLLLSTSANADLHYIDPEALYPAAQNVITLPGSTALAGFAALGGGFYAVAGDAPRSACSNGGMQVHVVKVDTAGDVNVTLDRTIEVPGTSSMEAMAALPARPHTVLAADAVGGRILRIDTCDRAVDVAFEHAALGPGGGDAAARGIKGLKIRGGHLYFTNAAQRTFGRFPIDANGTNTGDVEILARLDGALADGAVSYDDFGFDSRGDAFVAVHPSSIHRITPGGAQSVFAGGVNSTVLEPTSVVVSNSGQSIYISTAGKDTGYPISGGQVLKVRVQDTCA